MLGHPYRRQLAPLIFGGISIIQIIDVEASSRGEQADHLIQFSRTKQPQKPKYYCLSPDIHPKQLLKLMSYSKDLDSQCTASDFLTKLKSHRHIKKHLSLEVDEPNLQNHSLILSQSFFKEFYFASLKKYESESEIESKWTSFMNFQKNPLEFKQLIKVIASQPMNNLKKNINPEIQIELIEKDQDEVKQQSNASKSKMYSKSQEKHNNRKLLESQTEVKSKQEKGDLLKMLRGQVKQIKQILAAGQCFIKGN